MIKKNAMRAHRTTTSTTGFLVSNLLMRSNCNPSVGYAPGLCSAQITRTVPVVDETSGVARLLEREELTVMADHGQIYVYASQPRAIPMTSITVQSFGRSTTRPIRAGSSGPPAAGPST